MASKTFIIHLNGLYLRIFPSFEGLTISFIRLLFLFRRDGLMIIVANNAVGMRFHSILISYFLMGLYISLVYQNVLIFSNVYHNYHVWNLNGTTALKIQLTVFFCAMGACPDRPEKSWCPSLASGRNQLFTVGLYSCFVWPFPLFKQQKL